MAKRAGQSRVTPAETQAPFLVQIAARDTPFTRGDLRRRSGGEDLAAAVAAFGAEVDDVVGGFDELDVVLDDDDGVAAVDEIAERLDELGRRRCEWRPVVGSSKRKRRPVSLFDALGEERRELEALRFAAGERGGRLAEAEVAEADGAEGGELFEQRALVDEEASSPRRRSSSGCRSRCGPLYVTFMTCSLKRLPPHLSQTTSTSARNCMSIVTVPAPSQTSQRPPAVLNENMPAVTPFSFAAVVSDEDLADLVPRLHVRRGIRARRAADRRLIDELHVVDLVDAFERRRCRLRGRSRRGRRAGSGCRGSCG